MDKYEFNIKIDQIKKLAAKKDYKSAARIANSMDWRKVKDWATLATVINVQEASGHIEEARDTAIIAYNRNQGGRRLVYKLTELFIRLGQFDDAEELYDEYMHMASHDVSRLILEYKLRKAQNAQVGTLIEILEEYKDQEIDEKYMFELAQLYSYANKIDKCVHICDEIILWFPDGDYVDSAIRLKQKYVNITSTQQKLFEEAVKKKDMPDEEETKELMFAKAHEEVRYSDELEDELKEESADDNTALYSAQTSGESEGEEEYYEENEEEYYGEEEAAYQEEENSYGSEQYVYDQQGEDEYADGTGERQQEDGPAVDLIQNEEDEDAKSFFKALLGRVEANRRKEENRSESDQDEPFAGDQEETDDEDADNVIREFATHDRANIEKTKRSLNALIAKAKQNIEDSYEIARRQNAEDDLEKTAKEIEMSVEDYNMYDTRTLQAELAKNLDEIMQQEESDPDVYEKGNTVSLERTQEDIQEEPEEEQIEGQMSIADWVEAVQEKKYGKQETREFSKAELERELAERESKEEAYDRLMAKQREYAQQSGIPFNEFQARRNAKHELFLQSVKTDLDIRTGKAAARMESDVVKQKDDDKIWLFTYKTRNIEENTAADIETAAVVEQPDASDGYEEVPGADDAEYFAREVGEMLGQNAVTQEMPQEAEGEDIYNDEYNSGYDDADDNSEEGYYGEESSEEYDDGYYDDQEYFDEHDSTEQDAYDADQEAGDGSDLLEETEPKGRRSFFGFGKKKDDGRRDIFDGYDSDYDDAGDDGQEYEEEYEPEIPKEVRKFFGKYNDMDGVTEQLAEYFDVAGDEIGQETSQRGNIIISGNRSADKTNLAKNIARALNQLYPEYPRKIAKTTGESINQRGITRSLPKLMGTVLIIEEAGSIIPKRVNELLSVMQQNTGGMLVVLIDSDSDINVLLSVNPGIEDMFDHRIVIKQYSVAELVEYARKYAGKRQHVVNDDALTLLYMKINKISKEKEYVRTDEVKEIIDKAIVNAEKRASRRLFGRRIRRGGEYSVLTESDFKE